ncbi:MAG TPA: hypothetical protein VIB38_02355 [Aestuariivirgaceae bacterium]
MASFAGGGFVFNYRIGEAFYGVVINTEGKLPQEALIEASFENPMGGQAILVTDKIRDGQRRYTLRTPALKGIKKDVPYKVVVQILAKPGGEVVQRIERTFRSQVDQSMIPQGPLIIGPGYTLNPENDITKP